VCRFSDSLPADFVCVVEPKSGLLKILTPLSRLAGPFPLTQALNCTQQPLWRNATASIAAAAGRRRRRGGGGGSSSKQQHQAAAASRRRSRRSGRRRSSSLRSASRHYTCRAMCTAGCSLASSLHQRKTCAFVSWHAYLTPVTSHPQQPPASTAASDHQPRPPLRPSKAATRGAARFRRTSWTSLSIASPFIPRRMSVSTTRHVIVLGESNCGKVRAPVFHV
jgi:hypothetical protein